MSALIVLLTTYSLFTLYSFLFRKHSIEEVWRGRIALAVMFICTCVGHYVKTTEMINMLPEALAYRNEIVQITGAFEIIGALGILFPKSSKMTGYLLIIFLIMILPANIYGALNHVKFGGMSAGPVYLFLRIPAQMFFIWWTYHYCVSKTLEKEYSLTNK